jgi:poly-gamma-glutamate capsule biosynthesis protein CapA/YwtB (metallophosphatase superfamily)
MFATISRMSKLHERHRKTETDFFFHQSWGRVPINRPFFNLPMLHLFNHMKYTAILLTASVISFGFLFAADISGNIKVQSDSGKTVKIAVAGDLMCHSPEIDYARSSKDSLDFNSVFSAVKKELTASDLTIGNLETTVSGSDKKFSGYPLFNSPDQFLEAIKDAGFNFLFTSNNHCLDRGKEGLLRTLSKIRKMNIGSAGTYSSQKERDSIRILNVKGFHIALLAYTYGVNGNKIPGDSKYLVNIIDTVLIKKDIGTARAGGAEIVIVYFHFGDEYRREPSSYQKSIVETTFGYGADIILGSHPHVIQKARFQEKKTGKLRKGFVAYSLGNFISNQRWRYSDCGVILNLTLTKMENGSIEISDVSILPTWVFKGKIGSQNRFVIIPSDTSRYSLPGYLSKKERSLLLQSSSDTKKIFDSVITNKN